MFGVKKIWKMLLTGDFICHDSFDTLSVLSLLFLQSLIYPSHVDPKFFFLGRAL